MIFLRLLVPALALVNAGLYCCLLPLWEGFDEPFHYAYVQSLSSAHELPRLGQSHISREVYRSLNLAPLSFILARSVPGTIAFEDWFHLSQEQRLDRRAALGASGATTGGIQPSNLVNYEAQQAPLAYLVLAPLDAAWQNVPLPERVLWLRIALSTAATVLMLWGIEKISRTLGLKPLMSSLFALSIFEVQIVAAAVYHVANDWLSIVAAVWFAAFVAQILYAPKPAPAYALAVVTAVGLLAKAYFLAFVPLFFLVLLYARWRASLPSRALLRAVGLFVLLSAPWYLRNLLVSGSLAGMQENAKGVTHADALYAFGHIHWPRVLVESARWSLWTGNESHLAFSQTTLNLQLCLLGLGALLYVVQIRKATPAEAGLLLAAAFFALALVYDLCITWSDTHGLQNTTGPYYSPCLLVPLFALLFLGIQRSGIAGRALAILLSLLSGWIAVLTYLAKLIPYYGGYIGRGTARAVWNWWVASPKQILAVTTLGPVETVYALLLLYLLLLMLIHSLVIVRLIRPSKEEMF